MMNSETVEPTGPDPAVLPISEVSRRTGIPVAGLRNWEQRYGLPRPQRTSSGQRRYRESDCALLAEVLRGRASGLSLTAAMAHALSSAGRNSPASIFAGLRTRHPGLGSHVLTKAVLLALTRAIEDECCARAQRPVLVGAFQHQRYYARPRARWTDLARSAEQTIVFADFERARHRPGPVAEVPIHASSPIHREWALICDAPDHPACVAAWELPGQEHRRDRGRLFESLWSVDPQVVRDAARLGTRLAAADFPELPDALGARLDEEAPPSSADLRRASGLLERALAYLVPSSGAAGYGPDPL